MGLRVTAGIRTRANLVLFAGTRSRNNLTFVSSVDDYPPDGVIPIFLETNTPSDKGVLLLENGWHLLTEESLPWV
jgi:hypothetical protein